MTASIPERRKDYLNTFTLQKPEKWDKIIVVDTSDIYFLERQCGFNLDAIIEIFDHHPWYEQFWQEKIGEKAHIEEIGAAATLITQYIMEHHVFEKISTSIKELLACAIISNSVNFTAKISKPIDKEIYEKILENLHKDPQEFSEKYFKEVDDNYFSYPEYFLKNDTKFLDMWGKKGKISQIEMSENKIFIDKYLDKIESILDGEEDFSFLITSSARNQETYFVSFCPTTKAMLEHILWSSFVWNILQYDGIMLRKEIIKKMLKHKVWLTT